MHICDHLWGNQHYFDGKFIFSIPSLLMSNLYKLGSGNYQSCSLKRLKFLGCPVPILVCI